ncbi:MAG: NAD(P)/FAD-dependent oxidoreductase [Muribaculaceae bacterium]|nr:NAD(P)/FAD-dependent oxidoreductase [Muribaculaceae bacterium]
MDKQKIVVLGGGFAGLNFIKRINSSRYAITLVDRNNFHGFPPLFYQVASSGLDPTDISFPFRREMRHSTDDGSRFHLGSVKSVDMSRKVVVTDTGEIPYDKLVIAMGTTNNFFSSPELLDKVYTLKSMDEAIRLRNEILYRCEMAAVEKDRSKQRAMLSFAVVGGGPAGVEIAGAIGEVKRYVIPKEFPEINPEDMTIHLLEGTDRLLRTMSEKSSETAAKDLKHLMVEVKLGKIMKSYDNDIITLNDGSTIPVGMVIWTAGVTGVPFEFIGATDVKAMQGPGGRVNTDDHCRVVGCKDIYAIGDIGYFSTPKYPRGLPQLAQVAIQQGRYVAEMLNTGKDKGAFKYHDKGSMATIGRNRAVAQMPGGATLTGWLAWMAWMFIHLISLLGMRNKLNVLTNWVWAYFTHNTALRLLLKGSPHPKRGNMHDRG